MPGRLTTKQIDNALRTQTSETARPALGLAGCLATSAALLVGCVGADADGTQAAAPIQASALPRRIAPLAGATLTSRRPVLRWSASPRAGELRIELCADRACATVEQSLVAYGRSARPTGDLSPGTHFWRLAGAAGATSAWAFVVPARDTPLSTVTGYVPDYDGDGIPDLAISAPGTFRDPRGIAPRGYLHVFYGHRPLPVGTMLDTPDATFGAELPPPDLGNAIGLYTVASLGDTDGDGAGDLAVSAGDSVFVYPGGPNGLTAYATRFQGTTYARGAGDVNADGYADVIVGRSLHLGSAAGIAPTPAFTWTGASTGPLVAAGDVNGDGFADVGAMEGTAPAVWLGGATGISTRVRRVTRTPGFALRSLVNAGDLNADGVSDLAVAGSLPDGKSAAFVYFGTPDGYRVTADHTVTPPLDRVSPFAEVMAPAGDVDGDGYDDLMIRGDRLPTGETFVWVYLGGDGALSAAPARTLAGSTSVRFAASLSRLGDLDGDGRADAVVTRAAVSDFVGGQLLAYPGGAGGIGADPLLTVRVGSSRDLFAQRHAGWN